MKLTDAHVERFRDDGFLILPSYFSKAEVEILKAELPRLFAERRPENFREKESDAVRSAMALHQRCNVYAKLVRHPASWCRRHSSWAGISISNRSR